MSLFGDGEGDIDEGGREEGDLADGEESLVVENAYKMHYWPVLCRYLRR